MNKIQKENRRLIILANNPEAKDYEEALTKEMKKLGCRFFHNNDIHVVLSNDRTKSAYAWYHGVNKTTPKQSVGLCWVDEVMGLPLTLDRVLCAISYNNKVTYKKVSYIIKSWIFNMPYRWQEPVLDRQSEKIQRAVNELLTKEEESAND